VTGAWAVVPVKCFTRGKSRLDALLGSALREELARALASHVLDVLADVGRSGGIDGVLVATDCALVETFARARGALVVRDTSVGSLASVVDGALGVLSDSGAHRALVLMSDLPLLAPHEVPALVAALNDAPLVLAPDRRDEGTNALGLALTGKGRTFGTCFGAVGSFDLHRARAARAGITPAIHRSEGTACDLDGPDDLALASTYAERGARFSTKRNRSSRVRAA
jgi:2-phospho-L-lactate guanylyltransferase